MILKGGSRVEYFDDKLVLCVFMLVGLEISMNLFGSK